MKLKNIGAAALAAAAAAFASPADAQQIDAKYAQLGGAASFLGAPTIPETTAPDGVGRFRHYAGGSIYFHPDTDAHEVHGLIRQRWAALNWELGYLGYPMTDEINLKDGSGKVSKFQGGELIWRSATNAVSEVKSTDLVIDWPFPVGEPWAIIQANANAMNAASHSNSFAYCWDMARAGQASEGLPFVAAAKARIVLVEEGLGSGASNDGNVVVQRFGQGRYGSYLHIKKGSYSKQFATGPGLNFLPQALPWASRPIPATGAALGEVGDTGTTNSHMHFCVTTTPDRAAYKPFESVPVAFRNYSFSTDSGASWTFVSVGVPKNGQWVRREASKSGQITAAKVNSSAKTISFGIVKGQIMLTAGDGKPTGAGSFKIGVTSAWGEPLNSATVPVTASNLNGPWPFQLYNVPAFKGHKLWVAYSGPWSLPFDSVGGESAAFNLAPNATATKSLQVKTTTFKLN